MQYMQTHKKRPSKYSHEDRFMLNWLKYNKKLLACHKLPANREAMFAELLAKAKDLRRLNQYAYVNSGAENRPAPTEPEVY